MVILVPKIHHPIHQRRPPLWVQWWTFEPLRSRRACLWMPTDLTTPAGTWPPCILKAETTTLLDRNN